LRALLSCIIPDRSAQVVESVLVVNPGFLSKRRGAGTYAKVTVRAATMTEEERNSKSMIGHKLFDRARVDILRI
jgi:DNA polymerase alpha subunit B